MLIYKCYSILQKPDFHLVQTMLIHFGVFRVQTWQLALFFFYTLHFFPIETTTLQLLHPLPHSDKEGGMVKSDRRTSAALGESQGWQFILLDISSIYVRIGIYKAGSLYVIYMLGMYLNNLTYKSYKAIIPINWSMIPTILFTIMIWAVAQVVWLLLTLQSILG